MPLTLRQPRQHEVHGEVPYITSRTLDRLLRDSSIPILVGFQTHRSEELVHSLETVAAALDGTLHVLRVNVLTSPDLVARFSIRVVPTLLFFKMGVPTEFIVGTVPLRFVLQMACKVVGVRRKALCVRPGIPERIPPATGALRQSSRGPRRHNAQEMQAMRDHHDPNEWDSPPSRTAGKQRACLRCNRMFLSEGVHHRLCGACRASLATAPTPVEAYSLRLP